MRRSSHTSHFALLAAILESGEIFMDNESPVVTESNKDRVRQGVTGHNVRYVLFASVALVIVLFIAVAVFMRP
jgi:hypothetical protein